MVEEHCAGVLDDCLLARLGGTLWWNPALFRGKLHSAILFPVKGRITKEEVCVLILVLTDLCLVGSLRL